MKIVICGGGIIGISCAYFLAKKNISCTIIEQEDLACAASGKAGGFLCKTWCESNASDDLAKLSYKLHMELSNIFTDVDYRNVNTYSASVDKGNSSKVKKLEISLDWIDGPLTKCSLLESTDNTSQVNPKKLCKKLFEESKRLTNNATTVIHDVVIGLEFDESKPKPVIKSVKLKSGETIDADVVLIAMGPWSYHAMNWFPEGSIPKFHGNQAHSIILKVPEGINIPADCIFLKYKDETDSIYPEIYSRPDGTVYLCGFEEYAELPSKASEVEVDSSKCNQLKEIANIACSKLVDSEILVEQACFLPVSPDGIPAIGKISTVEGAYIAAGHSCWGILNSTGTGFVMAELITTGKCLSLDLQPFDPSRFK